MKFSLKVIGKTSKSQFKINIYLLKYIVAKQNVYHKKELSMLNAQERANMRAAYLIQTRTLSSIIRLN